MSKVISRHLTKNNAHHRASTEAMQRKTKGRSSGWERLNYSVEKGFLHWKVIES